MSENIDAAEGSLMLDFNPSNKKITVTVVDNTKSIKVTLSEDEAIQMASYLLKKYTDHSTIQSALLKIRGNPLIIKESKDFTSNYAVNTIMKHRYYIVHQPEKFEATVNINIPDKEINLFDVENIQNACGVFMEEMGFELEKEDHPVYGSFFQRLKYILKQPSTHQELEKVYDQGKLALQSKLLNAPLADATEKYANSASKLIDSLGQVENAVIRLGALLIIKSTVDGKQQLSIQTISPLLADLFDEKPDLLKSPETVLALFEKELKKLPPEQEASGVVHIISPQG